MGSKKELQAAIAVLGLCMLVFGCTKTAESENSKKQVKIGVAVYNEEDVYVSKICGYLEDEIFQYEKDHPGVEIRKKIADARGSQQEQNDQIDQFISLDYDLLLVNIVDRTNAAVIIDKATQADIPVVFFNREPVREDIFRSDQIYYEGSDAKQSAILQADVIADALEKNRSKIQTAYKVSPFTKGTCPEPEDAVKRFESRYTPIPAEYRWLLLNFGGCYLAEPWIFTLKELEEAYPIFQEAYEDYMSEYDHGPTFPIGGLGDGSIVFIDLESGRVRGYNCDYADLEEIAENFSSLLLGLVEQALELGNLCKEL